MKYSLRAVFAALLLVSALVCGASYAEASQKADSLETWEGTWNNFSSYFENPGLDEAYKILAEREGKSAAEIKKRYVGGRTYECDIPAMSIDKGTVVFYSQLRHREGTPSYSNATATAKYRFVNMIKDDFDRGWSHFEAVGAAPYKHLLLSLPEADIPGKTMTHFHFRYGNDLSELKAAKGWFPTMTLYDSDISLLVGHMTK